MVMDGCRVQRFAPPVAGATHHRGTGPRDCPVLPETHEAVGPACQWRHAPVFDDAVGQGRSSSGRAASALAALRSGGALAEVRGRRGWPGHVGGPGRAAAPDRRRVRPDQQCRSGGGGQPGRRRLQHSPPGEQRRSAHGERPLRCGYSPGARPVLPSLAPPGRSLVRLLLVANRSSVRETGQTPSHGHITDAVASRVLESLLGPREGYERRVGA